MKLRCVACLGLLHLVLSSASRSQALPKLDQILPRVQDHVKEFELSLPDFICDEKITSRELMGGKTIHETDIDSTFRGTQNKDEKDKPFTEWRDIQTIDGRPSPKGQQLTGPFFFGGGFSSTLDAIFSLKNAQYFNYKVIGTERVDAKSTVVIRFETKKGTKRVAPSGNVGQPVHPEGNRKSMDRSVVHERASTGAPISGSSCPGRCAVRCNRLRASGDQWKNFLDAQNSNG